MKKNLHRLLLVIGTAAIAALPTDAQQPTTLGAARVTLIAGPSPSKGGRTEVIRRAARSPQNIVIVSTNANADDLSGALVLINALRQEYGDALSTDFRARPETVRHGPTWKDSPYRKWLNEQLVRLRKAPEVNLGELGVAKVVHITLPPPRASNAGTGGGSS